MPTKENKKVLIIIFLIITIASIAMVFQKSNQYQHNLYINSDEISSSLKDGDVIFRMGDAVWSLYFRDMSPTDKRFSHLGIVRIRNNHITVISAEALTEGGDFVKEVTLGKFLSHALSAGIYRVNNIDGALISDAAVEYVGCPFDWDFDKDEDEKIYCSELLYAVLKKLDPSIKLNTTWISRVNKYVVPIDVYLQTEYFTQIGYWGKKR
ncbi:MAG: hypothetical protein FWD13_10085 [Treponema sp.]|nr:hypothetical protein [Treponema sp.]